MTILVYPGLKTCLIATLRRKLNVNTEYLYLMGMGHILHLLLLTIVIKTRYSWLYFLPIQPTRCSRLMCACLSHSHRPTPTSSQLSLRGARGYQQLRRVTSFPCSRRRGRPPLRNPQYSTPLKPLVYGPLTPPLYSKGSTTPPLMTRGSRESSTSSTQRVRLEENEAYNQGERYR